MKVVPVRVEEQINKVDRTPSLVIGIVCSVIAAWCIISLLQIISVLMIFSEWGIGIGSLFFQFVLYGAAIAVFGIAAFGFITRYSKTS